MAPAAVARLTVACSTLDGAAVAVVKSFSDFSDHLIAE